jgi:hypothetical protein
MVVAPGRITMFTIQLLAAANAARRAIPSLGLAATVLASTLVPAAPVNAADPYREPPKPAARVQVVVQVVHIYDDRDPGDGEMHLQVHLSCTAVSTPCLGQPRADLDDYKQTFSAMTEETVPLGQVLPRSAPINPQYEASADTGYPLYPGQAYQLDFSMRESDLLTADDLMGDRHIMFTQENGWALGTYKLRSVDETRWGDYEIEFEVRKAPLPDLRPLNITLHPSPIATKERVCMAVQNAGIADAGPFELALRVDGVVPSDGRATAGGLPAGGVSERCVDTRLPTSGQHRLEAVIDEPQALVEYDETNNVYEQAYIATLQPASASAQQGSTAATDQADLTVRAIKLNGQPPNGSDACKPGKNVVSVVVKNSGKGDAGSFAVQLTVDGDTVDATVDSLGAGQEREVSFDDVALKKGLRMLRAVADAGHAIDESKDDNNELKAAVTCKGA